MAKFLIEWGMRDGPMLRDVVEAENSEIAEMMAYDQAVDLWESNKIHTAKPFKDKHERLQADTVSRDRGVRDIDHVRRSVGDPSEMKP